MLTAVFPFPFPDVVFHSREFGNGHSHTRDSQAPGNDTANITVDNGCKSIQGVHHWAVYIHVTNQCDAQAVMSVRGSQLGLHRISASASANPKFGHFSQIRLRPNFWPNLVDANATAVRSVSYLIMDKH